MYKASSESELLYPTPKESNATNENLKPNSGSAAYYSFSISNVISYSFIYINKSFLSSSTNVLENDLINSFLK